MVINYTYEIEESDMNFNITITTPYKNVENKIPLDCSSLLNFSFRKNNAKFINNDKLIMAGKFLSVTK